MPNYYYVSVDGSGTKTTGTSSTTTKDGDWSASNMYPEFDDAYEYWFANDANPDSVIVFDDGVYTNVGGPTRVFLDKATTQPLKVTSRSGNTELVGAEATWRVLNATPSSSASDYTFSGFGNLRHSLGSGNGEQIAEFRNQIANVTLSHMDIGGSDFTANFFHEEGRIVEYSDGPGLTMKDVRIRGNTIVSTSNTSFVSLKNGACVFEDVSIVGCSSETASADASDILVFGDADLTWRGGRIANCTYETTGATNRHGCIRLEGTGTVTLSDITMENCTFSGTGATDSNLTGGIFVDTAGASSAADHTVSNIVFRNNRTINMDNKRGGAICANGDGSHIVATDLLIEGNSGFYGAGAYGGVGGRIDVERIIGRNNTGVASVSVGPSNAVVYFGGGAVDGYLKAALFLDNEADNEGVALYIHNSDTPAVPAPRTITVEHMTTNGNTGSDPIAIFGANQPLTVNFINCAFGEDAPIGIYGVGPENITLNFTNCAGKDTMANLLGGNQVPGSVTETGTIILDEPCDAKGSPHPSLYEAGSTTATTTADVNGVPYGDKPAVGAYASPSSAGQYKGMTTAHQSVQAARVGL